MTPVTYPLLGIIDSQKSGHLSNFFSIATVTASGGESSLSFTSIPSTYSHLQIRGIYRDTISDSYSKYLSVNVNGSSSGYSGHRLYGDSSAVTSAGESSTSLFQFISAGVDAGSTAGIFGVSIIDFIDYANTSKNKTVKAISGADTNVNNTYFRIGLSSGAWYSTSAITSITLAPQGTAFAAGTTFALYGIS